MKAIFARFCIAVIFMCALLLAGGILLSPALTTPTFTAGAATAAYTSVLDDLKQDPNFKSADYPAEPDTKYSFSVIQIAESTKGELFVYTYQPSAGVKKLSATSISMSITINENYSPKLYTLTELSSQGVFGKYLVNDFEVQEQSVRYYDIPEIFREWNAEIDAPATGASTSGTTISEVSFAVGKLFTARTDNGEISYMCSETETIEIINPYHGSLRYLNGFTFYVDSCDSWFIAFSTDKKIDRLMEARVYYVSRTHTREVVLGLIPVDTYGEYEEHYIDVTDKDKASNTPHSWLGGKPREWDRIQSVSEFIETEDLSSAAEKEIAGKEWVLRFAETAYEHSNSGKMSSVRETEISDVSILRLKFETDGIVYNLGAVDNKYTPDNDPDNTWEDQTDFDWDTIVPLPNLPNINDLLDWLISVWNAIVAFFTGGSDWWVYVVVAVVVLLLLPTILALIIPAFKNVLLSVLNAIGKGVLWLLKAIWWIITLPFRVIAALVRAISNRAGKKT